MRRANIGAQRTVAGWDCYDVDVAAGAGPMLYWDIREPLMDGGSRVAHVYDYGVISHCLMALDHHELVPALRNIRAILKPGGVLRVIDIDVRKGLDAFEREDTRWFPQDDRTGGFDAKFCTWITWFGTRKSVFTSSYMRELLTAAGFSRITHELDYQGSYSEDLGITELDDRERESFFIEATA